MKDSSFLLLVDLLKDSTFAIRQDLSEIRSLLRDDEHQRVSDDVCATDLPTDQVAPIPQSVDFSEATGDDFSGLGADNYQLLINAPEEYCIAPTLQKITSLPSEIPSTVQEDTEAGKNYLTASSEKNPAMNTVVASLRDTGQENCFYMEQRKPD